MKDLLGVMVRLMQGLDDLFSYFARESIWFLEFGAAPLLGMERKMTADFLSKSSIR